MSFFSSRENPSEAGAIYAKAREIANEPEHQDVPISLFAEAAEATVGATQASDAHPASESLTYGRL